MNEEDEILTKILFEIFKNVVLNLRKAGYTKTLIRDHFETFMNWNLVVMDIPRKPPDCIIVAKKETESKERDEE